jgi:signal transduction histidine kinase
MSRLDGEVTRRPVGEVMAELEVAEDAAESAAREARRTIREQHKAELSAGLEERVSKLKETLHVA